jgi:hypothetical protein
MAASGHDAGCAAADGALSTVEVSRSVEAA